MVGTTCTICLDDVKSPVSIPCGHLHCEGCLVQYVEQHDEVAEAPCPTCRAPFCIATPDLRFVPAKYHKYIVPTVRRVYLSQPTPQPHPENVTYLRSVISALEDRAETLEGTNTSLRTRVTNLEKRVANMSQDKERLMDRCESSMASVKKLGEKEREARQGKEKLEKELDTLRKKYEVVKGKYKALKHAKPPAAPSPMHRSTSTKRTSAQAALDADIKLEEAQDSGARLILPIPKRPRMAFGWRPTSDAVASETEEDRGRVKTEEEDEELEYEEDDVKVKTEDEGEDSLMHSMPAFTSGLSEAPSPFTRVKREPAQSPNPAFSSASRRSSLSPRRPPPMATASEPEDEDEDDEGALRFAMKPLPGLNFTEFVKSYSNSKNKKQPSQLKPSGLSKVFQSMDVDDEEFHSASSALNSSPRAPTPGPSSRPISRGTPWQPPSFLKPSRSGLSTGDIFSPRRQSTGRSGGNGSIDYMSSPLRMPDDEEEVDVKSRSYVFRGKKISAVLETRVRGWETKL